MTKFEMAMEIMKNVKWSEAHKYRVAKVAEKRHSKESMAELYNNFLKDKEQALSEHALFYASLL